ncbi:MAG TPA: hypothetical protein VI488_03715 [Candidatus Angelobacter sp.]
MKDWKALTIGVYETVGPIRTHLLQLEQSAPIAVSEKSVIHELFQDLQQKQVALERARAMYEGGHIRIYVTRPEESAFQTLQQDLARHTDYSLVQQRVLSVADVVKYRDYLQNFLSVGPHGSGRGEPSESDFRGPDSHGPSGGEPSGG